MGQLDVIEKQVRAAVRNQAAGAVSAVRSETSLVRQASRLTGKLAGQKEKQSRKAEVAQPSVPPAPDGYVRRSPVQPVREDPSYRAGIIKKVVGTVVLLVCAAVVLWLLIKTSLLAF